MKWGFFGPVHIATLIFAAAMIMGLYLILRNRSQKVQMLGLGLLSLSGVAAIVYNLVTWDSPWEYLPLHLCSVNAALLPITVFSRNKTMGNLLLVWSLGALAAIVVNNAQADFELMSATFCFYYFPHVLEFGIPLLLVKLGLVEKDARCIGSTMGLTVVTYTIVHICNLVINELDLVDKFGRDIVVNYMYSLVPENPVMQLCWNILPKRYWYMFLIFPIIGVYLLGIYAPQLVRMVRKHQKAAA